MTRSGEVKTVTKLKREPQCNLSDKMTSEAFLRFNIFNNVTF